MGNAGCLWKNIRLSHRRFSLISFRGSETKGVGRSRQRARTFFESTHLTTAAKAVVSHSHGSRRRGRKVAQSGWREERRTCPWVVRIAKADVLMRGSGPSESSGEGCRREGHRWKARSSWDAALFHHTAAAKVLGGNERATGTGALRAPRRRVTGSALGRFGGRSARLSERGGVKPPAHR